MNAAGWERAKDVIAEALKQPASERETFIRAHCSEPSLPAEIIDLLATYDDAAVSFLDHPPSLDDPNDDADPDNLAPGTRIGPYMVLDRIGRGGMGQVFLGSDPRLRRKVALKCLISSKSPVGDRRSRILHEARAAACITHPNIAAVHDVIEHDHRAFIVMEYVESESLAARLNPSGLGDERSIQAWKLMSVYRYTFDEHWSGGGGIGFMPFSGEDSDLFSRGIASATLLWYPADTSWAKGFFVRPELSYITQGLNGALFNNVSTTYSTTHEWNWSIASGWDLRR
jgi:hypothetical protein